MEVPCYNRSCGKTFDEFSDSRSDDECQFHPGAPCFHDAYKEWTCCGKKSTDFTEWLNYPGCTRGRHSNVKPVEPEKITGNLNKEDGETPETTTETEMVRKSHEQIAKSRPSPDAPLVRVKPDVAKSLRDELEKNPLEKSKLSDDGGAGEVKVGEPCKNGGCKVCFVGDPDQDEALNCQHHPGVPIFHEGMKYWSCCQKKTTDFQSFLNQAGCTTDKHRWIKETSNSNDQSVACRYDWHQTAEKVTVAVYAKKFDPDSSFVDLNPVRMKIHIYFPEQGGSFDEDICLGGVVRVESCSVGMFKTKVEIQLKKAEAGSWSKLQMPKSQTLIKSSAAASGVQSAAVNNSQDAVPTAKVDALDLDDLEVANTKYTLSKEASTPKY